MPGSEDRIAVIADIHGNSDALKAVLADIDAHRIKTILNLGDHFSGPLSAGETAEVLMTREMICIAGNHDRWMIEKHPDDMGASDRAALDQLSPAHLDWMRSLPPTRSVWNDIFMCHGTPQGDNTYWLDMLSRDGGIVARDRESVEAEAVGISSSLILCGHTHIPKCVRLKDGRLVVNPGSVGLQAYDDDLPVYHVIQTGAPDARYALLTKGELGWQVSFRTVPYDTERMVERARHAGREDWAQALETGWL